MGSANAADASWVSVGGTSTLVSGSGVYPRNLIAKNNPPDLAQAPLGVPLDRRGLPSAHEVNDANRKEGSPGDQRAPVCDPALVTGQPALEAIDRLGSALGREGVGDDRALQ